MRVKVLMAGLVGLVAAVVGVGLFVWTHSAEHPAWNRADIQDDGTALRLHYVGSSCEQFRSVNADEEETLVTVTITERSPTKSCGDSAEKRRTIRVNLARPLGDRVLLDGSCRPFEGDISECRVKVFDKGAHPYAVRKPLHAPAAYDPTIAGAVACSRVIATGRVVAVGDGEPGRVGVTIDVTDWIKPTTGPHRMTITGPDSGPDVAAPRPRVGRTVNLVLDVDPDSIVDWDLDAQTFAAFKNAVPEASGLECYYGP